MTAAGDLYKPIMKLFSLSGISILGARLGHVVSRMTTPQPLVLCGPSGEIPYV